MPVETIESLLDALAGVCHVVDRHLKIQFTSGVPLCGAPESLLDPGNCARDGIVGRDVLDVISDDATRAVYQGFCDQILNGERGEISFTYRDDTPGLRRNVRMFIRPLIRREEIVGAVFHNIEISAVQRPPIDLPLDTPGDDIDGRILVICSFCKKVQSSDDPQLSDWISAEEYYRRGGESHVRLSHGICEKCMDEIVEPNGVAFGRRPKNP